jgi:hypothetical protein
MLYKDIFKKPNEGVHSIRFANLAIVDVIMTVIVGIVVIAGYFIAEYFNLSLSLTLFTLFLIGIIAHQTFCVRNQTDKLLFK